MAYYRPLSDAARNAQCMIRAYDMFAHEPIVSIFVVPCAVLTINITTKA